MTTSPSVPGSRRSLCSVQARPRRTVPVEARGATVAVEFLANGPDGVVYDLRADEGPARGWPLTATSDRCASSAFPDAILCRGDRGVARLDVPFGSNLPESAGRWVSLIVDHESIRAGAEERRQRPGALCDGVGPRDQVSFIKAPRGCVESEFTTDHEKVVAALRRFVTARRGKTPNRIVRADPASC